LIVCLLICSSYGTYKNEVQGGKSFAAAIPINSPLVPNAAGKSTPGCFTPFY